MPSRTPRLRSPEKQPFERDPMVGETISESSFTATINAPVEQIDLTD
jgi:hypothetical protein